MIFSKFYAGVGSRQTPPEILKIMESAANLLSKDKWTLRSGGADGADLAFERGVPGISPRYIFLPYAGFNGSDSPHYLESYNVSTVQAAMKIASHIHPAWAKCSDFAKKCHARNIFQVLGPELESSSTYWSKFVVCWTKDGKSVGGTRTAIECARAKGIPVYNLAIPNDLKDFAKLVIGTENE